MNENQDLAVLSYMGMDNDNALEPLASELLKKDEVISRSPPIHLCEVPSKLPEPACHEHRVPSLALNDGTLQDRSHLDPGFISDLNIPETECAELEHGIYSIQTSGQIRNSF